MEAQRQRRRMQTEQLSNEETQRHRKNNKAAHTLTIIVTALLFSCMPILVLNMYAALSDDLVEPRMLYVISLWSFTSLLLGSFLNPLIYCWRFETLRCAFLDFMQFDPINPPQNDQPHLPREAWTTATTG